MSAVEVVGWTLLHFLWQGAAVAVSLAVLLAVISHRRATVRYGVSLAALAIMTGLPLATGVILSARRGESSGAGALSLPAPSVESGEPAVAAVAALDVSQTASGARPAGRDAGKDWLIGRGGEMLHQALPWLVGLWVTGVMLLSIRLVGGLTRARRLVTDGTRTASEAMEVLLASLSRQLGLSRRVRLLESVSLEVPAVIGWLRPVILLPVSALSGLTPQQVELLLAHELAHIRRYDYLINLFQSAIETLFFYHPAVWWTSRRIREEREHCCDDLAVALCGSPKVYARTLLQLEQLRSPAVTLAAAATGGDLLGRVRRLLDAEPARSEMGPRWAAGLLSLITVSLITVGLSAAESRGPKPAPPDKLISLSTPESPVWALPRDREQQKAGAPDTVLRHPDPSAPFAARLEWGRRTGRERRGGRYWVGYVVTGSAVPDRWVYFDRHVPIRTGDVTIYGHMRIGGPDQLSFSGVALRPLVGDHPGQDVAVFLGYEMVNGRPALRRIHLGSFGLPVHFGGWSLVWLGTATDAESVELVRSLYPSAGSAELAEDVVAAVGIHASSAVVVPVLLEWLKSSSPVPIRQEAAEWLAQHDDPRVLPGLSRVVWTDASDDVRREAVEAMGGVAGSAAADTIVRIARAHPDHSVRREAVETLGEREEPIAFDALVSIAKDDHSREIRMEAIETLGDLKDGRGVSQLMELAQSHPDIDSRREAVETLADAAPEPKTVEFLLRIARDDPSVAVRREAVETLGDMHDVPEAERALRNLIEQHPDAEVQKQGVEAISNSPGSDVLDVLRNVARTHPKTEVRREAIDGLASIEDPKAVEALHSIALSDPDVSLQAAAAEALGQAHPHEAALKALREIIWQHPAPAVARAAVEALGDLEGPAVIELLKEVIRRHPSIRVQREAVDVLTNLQR